MWSASLQQRPSAPGENGPPGGDRAPERVVAPPRTDSGATRWSFDGGPWRVLFVGKGAGRCAEPLQPGLERAWLHQVHGASIVEAGPGECGEADALRITVPGIAGCVATADCLPIALAGERAGVVVHAGWRGLVAGILPAAVAAVVGRGDRLTAWIGPAIGACCYEVGEEVAGAVASATGSTRCRVERPGRRPHLDLRCAAGDQLAALGLGRIVQLEHCTRCRGEWLWSHRRDRGGAGRNWALLWRAV